MQKMILSNNFNITDEDGRSSGQQKSKTASVSTSSSNTQATTVGVSTSVNANLSLFDLGVSTSLTANLSHDWSSTVTSDHSDSDTVTDEKSKTWTESLELNDSEVAYLNGNVKYLNIGTAPIYDVRPTLNFVLGIDKPQTIATIIAKSNTTANVILPNSIFPDKVQNPIAWNTIDDFNSQPIKLNYEQVKALGTGEQQLQIQTIQTSGLYKTYNTDMLPIVSEYQKWEHIMVDIYNRTACLTLVFEDCKFEERRVSARKEDNYDNQTQPELTLGEAILIAFNKVTIADKTITYKNVEFMLDHNTDVILDDRTSELIENQNKKDKLKNIFDIKLIQGMKIIFKINKDRNKEWKEVKEKLKLIENLIINERKEIVLSSIRKCGFSNETVIPSEVFEIIKKVIKEKSSPDIIPFIDELKINGVFIVEVLPDNKVGEVGLKIYLQFKNISSETFCVKSELG